MADLPITIINLSNTKFSFLMMNLLGHDPIHDFQKNSEELVNCKKALQNIKNLIEIKLQNQTLGGENNKYATEEEFGTETETETETETKTETETETETEKR